MPNLTGSRQTESGGKNQDVLRNLMINNKACGNFKLIESIAIWNWSPT